MKRLYLIAGLCLLIMQTAWADSLSVGCASVVSQGWVDPSSGCGSDDSRTSYVANTASESEVINWGFNLSGLPTGAVLDSLVPHIEGSTMNLTERTETYGWGNFDEPAAILYPYTDSLPYTESVRALSGHGMWGITDSTQTTWAGGQYVFVLAPINGTKDYDVTPLYVDDLWLTVWYHLPAGNNNRRKKIMEGQ
jgi:hypothetical protein